jgi:hypothetical protein
MSTLSNEQRAALQIAMEVLGPKRDATREISQMLEEDNQERAWAEFHALTEALERRSPTAGLTWVFPEQAARPYLVLPLPTVEALVALVRKWDGHSCRENW